MKSYEPVTLTKRDALALDRTRLANHRTILAYIRTAIILIISGITLIKIFSHDIVILYMGFAFFPLAVFALIIGIAVYFKTENKLKDLYKIQVNENKGKREKSGLTR